MATKIDPEAGFVLLTAADGIAVERIQERAETFDRLHGLCGDFYETEGWETYNEKSAALVMEIVECCKILTTPITAPVRAPRLRKGGVA